MTKSKPSRLDDGAIGLAPDGKSLVVVTDSESQDRTILVENEDGTKSKITLEAAKPRARFRQR